MAAPALVNPGAHGSGLPVPRFVSLRSDQVNIRTGPGARYPIEWVFRRRAMPVEIVAEFDTWRKIRDRDGTEGWVHQSMVSGRRMLVVQGGERKLRREADDQARIVARLADGVVARVRSCRAGWCRIEAGGYTGWLREGEYWGAYPNETID